MEGLLNDKTILITGSSRGIGAEVARVARHHGARVILHGSRMSEALAHVCKELESENVVCDVRDKQAVETQIRAIADNHRIDGLVNCAGIVQPKPFLASEDEDWLNEYRTNVLGTVHCCQSVIPVMQRQKHGRIVNVASIRGFSNMASARGMSYSSTKAAIVNITAALAKEFAPEIAVNAVAPGFTETDMAQTWNDTVRMQAKSSLLGRAAQPREIAEAIVFLLSESASFITGQTFLVDGGYAISGK